MPPLRYKKRYERSFHQGTITSAAFNSCGSLLVASSLDGFVSVWEVNTGSLLHCINARTPVHSLVWSSQPEGFIFGCENGMLVSVFIEKESIRSTYFHAHPGPIFCLSPRFNSTLLISGAADQVTVWKRDHSTRDESWEVFKTVPQPPDQYSQSGGVVQVTSLNWLNSHNSKERNRLIVASYQWHGVVCWDLVSLSILWRLASPDCSSLALAPAGNLAAAYSVSNSFEVYNIESRRLVQAMIFEAKPDLISPPIAFAHDGFAVIGGGVQGRACIWDAECGDELQALDHGGAFRINTLTTYSSENADTFLVATGTDEGEASRIVLWDTTPRVCDSSVNGRPWRNIGADSSPANWPVWMIVGVTASLLGWRWMG